MFKFTKLKWNKQIYKLFWWSKKKKGFKILYIPNVIPNTACTDILKLKYVTNRLNNKFGLDNDFDHLFFLPEKYFYDTSYHLTKKGTEIKTDFFIEVLKIYFKKS